MNTQIKTNLIVSLVVGGLIIIGAQRASATTYTANELLTTIVKAENELKWTVKNTFNKAIVLAKNLKVKGNTTLGTNTDNTVTVKGTVTNGDDATAIQVNDDLHLTGTLTLDEPLSASMVSSSGIVKNVVAGTSITIADGGNGTYTINAVGDGVGPTYTAGTGVSIASNQISSSLGTAITSDEITDGTVVDADTNGALTGAALAPDTLTAGDISTGAIATAEILDDTITNVDINSAANISATKIGTGLTDTQVDNNLTIAGGTIDNSAIGATTASTGNFTNLTVNGSARSVYALQQIPRTNTIAAIDNAASVGNFSSMTIGVDGYPVISYYDTTNTDLKVLKCGNADCSANNTITSVDTTGSTGQFTSIAIGTDGFPVISYYKNTGNDLLFVKCGNAACSSGNTLTSLDTGSNTGQFTSVVINTDGFPIIAYQAGVTLKSYKCGNAACNGGTPVLTVLDSSNTMQDISMTLDSDGYPIIAYNDFSAGDLEVYKCTSISCSTGGVVSLVTAPAAGYTPSITIGVDGKPIISYWNADTFTINAIHCTTISCSAADAAVVLDTTSVDIGNGTSITIGVDNNPVISYYDSNLQDLKVVKCGTTTCSANNTVMTIDSTGDVGFRSSLTLGTDGNPIISYYDTTNGDLKIVKAANSYFINNWTRR